MTFITIENGKLIIEYKNDKPRKFYLDDAEGPAKFLAENENHRVHISCSSSCDFPQESGAPEDFSFEEHWDNILDSISKMLGKPAITIADLESRIAKATEVAELHGMTDGAHHKQWVIDQMIQELLGDNYEAWLKDNADYWDQGIAP